MTTTSDFAEHTELTPAPSKNGTRSSPRLEENAPPHFDDDDRPPRDEDAPPEFVGQNAPTNVVEKSDTTDALPTLDTLLDGAIERMKRRHDGREKPIAISLPVLEPHFAGGFWPGVHYLMANTGVGKSAFVIQDALTTARAGIPVAYVGLELEHLQIVARLLGEQARVPWSKLYTGKLGEASMERAIESVDVLKGLPFHPYFGSPFTWPASRFEAVARALREKYPETDGPGSRPLKLVVDFLQLVGAEPGERVDVRERIAHAGYACRHVASTYNIACVVILSIARDKYSILREAKERVGLTWDEDPNGCPINRGMRDPDVLIGLGKESGDLEFSGDSVSVIFRATQWVDGEGCDVIFATPKSRASAAMWSPLHWTGFRFEECTDRGGRVLEAWKESQTARETKKADREALKEAEKKGKVLVDSITIIEFVLDAETPPTVTATRKAAVAANNRRWAPAIALLGAGLVKTEVEGKVLLSVCKDALPEDVKARVGR